MLYSHFENRRPDGDIYRELGSSIPAPSLPSELVLTDKNFREKISSSERTLVLFYLHCEHCLRYEVLCVNYFLDQGL